MTTLPKPTVLKPYLLVVTGQDWLPAAERLTLDDRDVNLMVPALGNYTDASLHKLLRVVLMQCMGRTPLNELGHATKEGAEPLVALVNETIADFIEHSRNREESGEAG